MYPRVENSNLCFFRCGLPGVGLALAKAGNGLGALPQWVAQCSIEGGLAGHTRRLSHARALLRRRSRSSRGGPGAGSREKGKQDQKKRATPQDEGKIKNVVFYGFGWGILT